MSKFDSNKVMPRYSAIAILMTVIAVLVVGKMLFLMTAKRDYWMKVADRVKCQCKADARQYLKL